MTNAADGGSGGASTSGGSTAGALDPTNLANQLLSDLFGNTYSRESVTKVLNPPFDSRMRRIGSPKVNPSKLKRGWIQSAEEEPVNWRINFLFNPSEINLAHSIDINAPSSAQIEANPNHVPGSQALFASLGSTLSFSLLYDRTYELWSTDQTGVDLAKAFGVYADVGAFYFYLGMIPKLPTNSPAHIRVPGEPDLVDTVGWTVLTPQGPPRMMQTLFYFGTKMFYYGYISGINVTYTHWSHDMVPIRCRVDLTVTLTMAPAVVKALEDIPPVTPPGEMLLSDPSTWGDGEQTPILPGYADQSSSQ